MVLYLHETPNDHLKEIANSEANRQFMLFDFDSRTFYESECISRLYVDEYGHYENEWMKIVSIVRDELLKRGEKPIDFRDADGKTIMLPDGKYLCKVTPYGLELTGPSIRHWRFRQDRKQLLFV